MRVGNLNIMKLNLNNDFIIKGIESSLFVLYLSNNDLPKQNSLLLALLGAQMSNIFL